MTDTPQVVTEKAIRRRLDGTFTRLTHEGTVKSVRVRTNFLPHYGLTLAAGDDDPSVRPEDDAAIIRGVRTGEGPTAISEDLGRSYSSVFDRMQWLRRQGLL